MAPETQIRAARSRDTPAIRQVYRRASLSNEGDRPLLDAHPEFLHWSDDGVGQGRTWVALVEGDVVGFVSLSVADGRVDLEDLFVDPDWTRRGIGRALVGEALERARSWGWEQVEVEANPHALEFYRAVGFVEVGEVALAHGTATKMRVPTEPTPPGP